MKINIKTEEHNLNVRMSNWLALNDLTYGFIVRKLKQNGVKVKRRQFKKFIKLCKKYKKKHKGWNLVEVETKNKENVIIEI